MFSHASEWLATIVLDLLLLIMVTAVVLYFIDRYQTRHAIRRNFPLIGRFRYLFEHLGEFFRQYFYSMDREELPFNRAQRAWVYRAAKNLDNTQAFGSTKDNSQFGDIIFNNAAYPWLDEGDKSICQIVFGADTPNPYASSSVFNVSAMSYGAISRPAVRALSSGAAMAGCWLNTGEGGLSEYHLEGNCDLVFQIGTAKYGVRDEQGNLDTRKLREVAAKPQIKMLELKLSQGAKPGKGGMLPGIKVTPEIAAIRGIPVGCDSNSPNRHLDAGNDQELLDLIHRVRETTGKPVGIKTVIGDGNWLDEFFTLINAQGKERAPDFITVDGGNGGTGAAPMTLIDDMGCNLPQSLPLVVNKLEQYGLRSRVRVIASGKLVNPAGVAWALCTGADCVVSARGFLFSLGCIQALQCNKNTCPTGITTHDPKLQRGLVPEDKAERVAHYHGNMMKELTTIAHSCGIEHPGLLQRKHASIVLDNSRSLPLTRFYQDDSFTRRQDNQGVVQVSESHQRSTDS